MIVCTYVDFLHVFCISYLLDQDILSNQFGVYIQGLILHKKIADGMYISSG